MGVIQIFKGNPKFPLGAKIRFLSLQKNTTKYSLIRTLFLTKQGPFFFLNFDLVSSKLTGMYSKQKEHMFAKIPSRGVKFRFRFSPPFLPPQKCSRKKEFSFFLISYFFFYKKKKRKGKPLSHFRFTVKSRRKVEEITQMRAFSPSLPFLFRRKNEEGVEEGEVFSLSFLSFSFLSPFFFRRKRREEELLFPSLFLPLGEDFFSHSFSFFLSFLRRKGERKTLFHFNFLTSLSSLFEEEKGEKNRGRRGSKKRK